MRTAILLATIPAALIAAAVPAEARANHSRHHQRHHVHGDIQARISDLDHTLAVKVVELKEACGSRLISAHRPGARIAGSGHPSLHSVYPARAADMSGNPSCIYAHLQGWRGGYSIDYGRVRHVHISWSPPGSGYLAGKEWHARFAHYGGGGHHHRYARHHTPSQALLGDLDYVPAPGHQSAQLHAVAERAHAYAASCGLTDLDRTVCR